MLHCNIFYYFTMNYFTLSNQRLHIALFIQFFYGTGSMFTNIGHFVFLYYRLFILRYIAIYTKIQNNITTKFRTFQFIPFHKRQPNHKQKKATNFNWIGHSGVYKMTKLLSKICYPLPLLRYFTLFNKKIVGFLVFGHFGLLGCFYDKSWCPVYGVSKLGTKFLLKIPYSYHVRDNLLFWNVKFLLYHGRVQRKCRFSYRTGFHIEVVGVFRCVRCRLEHFSRFNYIRSNTEIYL